MDLTTLTLFFMVIASAIGLDTALHPASVVLDASVAGKLDKITVDAETLNGMLTYEVMQICSTPSVLAAPEIRAGANKGIGLAIAESVRMQSLALALQSQLGYQPEEIKLTLLGEGDHIEALVSGSGLGGRIRTPPFQMHLVMQQGESLAALVHRAAVAGMIKIDPYITALYLIESHVEDGDFSQAEVLVEAVKTQLPQTPVSYDRSALENLQGIIALHRGQLDVANDWFHRASTSYPEDAASTLNAGFVDVQLGDYTKAERHVENLLATRPPADRTLLTTAYITWGAALLGKEQFDAAQQKAAKASEIDRFNSSAYELQSEIARAKGDAAAADRLHIKAWEVSDTFQYYTEVAALSFRLAFRPDQKLARNPFNNPGTIRFN
jgi:tetratricopeptide (TPR) repeat protein